MPRIAVVQPALELGAVEANLRRVDGLIRDAHRAHSPDVVLVPEAATSPNVYADVLLGAPRPVDGPLLALLRGLARELDCVIGGGGLAVRGRHAYGTYVLAEPDGSAHLHDKDIPTAWEQHYYRGGDDDGVVACRALGTTVGLMSGWEWARTRTSRRVRDGGVGLVLGGMCWPSFPTNWPGPLGRWMHHEHARWRAQCRDLPGQVARITGVPVAHAAHVGPVSGATPLVPGLRWPTTLLGESQICDRDGTVLARLTFEDGEGHVAADVEVRDPEPRDALPGRYWIPALSPLSQVAWHGLNAHGRLRYAVRHRHGGFPWQPTSGADLPDEVPAST
jgi:predicted amidohydrolase